MFSSILLIAATALAGMVSAQNTSSTPYYSTSGPLMIDPNDVTPGNRSAWCVSQRNECPFICGGSYANNTCEDSTLTYNCTCSGGGNQPNISNFDGTIPSFICQAWVGFCVDGHKNDLLGIQGCRSVQCGSVAVNTTPGANGDDSSSSSSSSPMTMTSTSTSSPSTSPTGSSSSSPATPSPSGNAAQVALTLGKSYGTGMMAAGMLAIFGLAL